tara:strand:- start:2824 stop:5106 length:2283 start_codon:yes stop_codon:yes gene_type:complete
MSWLVIGSCAREHSILKKLKKDNKTIKLYCCGKNTNPGILKIVDKFSILTTLEKLLHFCRSYNIKYAIIGPENYLSVGVVDFLEANQIQCIGPTQKLARIETDKFYARNLLEKNNMSTYNPLFKHIVALDTHQQIQEYYAFCEKLNFNYVIKPTNLCSGKGVKVSGTHFTNDLEGLMYTIELLKQNHTVLIEEKLEGEEFTLMSYSDGSFFSHMPIVTDFKQLEHNSGPNTGSMGCISYSNHQAPFLTESEVVLAQEINCKTVEILNADNNECYKGIIYGSFIKCSNGDLKIIEFNARYGDPECVNVLELLETSLFDIYNGILDARLLYLTPTYSNLNMVSKYLVPHFYPEKDERIYEIDNEWYQSNQSNIITSSMNEHGTLKLSTTSRTLVYFEKGGDLNTLSEKINSNLEVQNFKFRKDIGRSTVNSNTYLGSGVDIDKAQDIVESMSPFIKQTFNKDCFHSMGDYSGIIGIPKNYKEPVFISSIDGVGSKPSFLAKHTPDVYKIAGEDIVAHSINDILVKGADPFYFLDYIACETLEKKQILDVIEGMTQTCAKYNCPLVGGETAEMPNIYNKNEIDIAGCITGIAERADIIDGKKNIKINDHVLGLYSNGLHTNGFSLLRKIFDKCTLNQNFIDWVKQPHTCYYNEIKLLDNITINALVHITGGGLIDNPPRVLSQDKCMNIYKENLITPQFSYIQQQGNVTDEEMYRTLNCGIGFMIVLDEENYIKAKDIFHTNKIEYCRVGYISKRTAKAVNFI